MDDIGARFKKIRQQKDAEKENNELDIDEFYRIRAKMLGVLIRDARLNAARTEAECARIFNISVETYMSWEFGDASPSLPQLELLAFYLGVPVSHFWSQNTLKEEYTDTQRAENEYLKLRTRMVGALLRQAREEAQLSIEDLAKDAGIGVEQLSQYETGELAVPMHELNVLANGVNKSMSYFLDASGHIGELLAMREEWRHFTELPDDIRQFAANPVNIGFIEIAIMLSQMPTEKLRRVGSSIVDITM